MNCLQWWQLLYCLQQWRACSGDSCCTAFNSDVPAVVTVAALPSTVTCLQWWQFKEHSGWQSQISLILAVKVLRFFADSGKLWFLHVLSNLDSTFALDWTLYSEHYLLLLLFLKVYKEVYHCTLSITFTNLQDYPTWTTLSML